MKPARQHIITEISDNLLQLRRLVFSSLPARNKDMPTLAQMGVLFILENNPEKNVTNISRHFDMSISGATQLVDGLVEKKLLLRQENERDARKTTLILTAKGKKVLQEMKKIHGEIFKKAFKPLSDEELATMDTLQKKIIRHLK